MNMWTTLDHLLAMSTGTVRGTRSDDLVDEIADGLAVSGEYMTRVDLLPTHHVIDFTWAAHQAGRRLGIRVRVDVQYATAAAAGGLAQVRVARLRPLE